MNNEKIQEEEMRLKQYQSKVKVLDYIKKIPNFELWKMVQKIKKRQLHHFN